jgi:predicted nucleic acid-binding protein
MRIPKIYLETTIFNFPFVDDAPQYKADTIKLFEEIKAGKWKAFTSKYVLNELVKTADTARREKMNALVATYEVEILAPSDEIARLADIYINSGIIPAKFPDDALHIATASVYEMDYIISLNFKHIVKHKTIIETELINAREGYKRIFIHAPAEVIENG